MATPDDVAASLVDALAKGGEQVATGDFTLDPAKAREKLREHQLADAHEWILLAISAGHVATGGRGPVRVYAGPRTSVRFSGISVGAAELEQCFAAVFGRERGLEGEALTRAKVLRLLGLAANAALSLGSHVEIESIEASDEIRIDVHGRGQRRATRERELVLERCQLATTAIFLDDQRINQGPTSVMPLQHAKIRLGDTVVGVAAFEQHAVAPARALIINRGVLAETVTLAGYTPGFVAILDIDVPADLSQRQILRDEGWERLLAAIREVHDALPKPRPQPSELPSEGSARPITAMLVTAAVIGVVVFVSMLIPERPAPTEPVRPLHAEELPAQDPDVALAAMIGECQAGSIEACKRASRMTSDGQILAQIDHLLCFRGDQRSCESWLVRAQIICDDLTKCATLRELLRGQCLNGTTGEFCREAGWMAHLGYGGPVRPAYAKQVFEHDCNSTNENKAACEWRKLPPVSEQTCADGDAWACYGLGFEAYYWRRDVEASLAHVKRACEIGLEAGCRAVDLASEQIGPPLVFPD